MSNSEDQTPVEETQDEAVSDDAVNETVSEAVDEAVEEAATDEAVEESEDDKPIPYELLSSETRPGSVLVLEFKVEYEHYEEKNKDIFDDLQEETVIDGFRRGKAPLGLIRARYRREVKDETINSIQQNVLAQYAEKEEPQVLSAPEPEEIEEVKEGEPIVFKISMEVRPSLESIEYGDLAVEVESRDMSDDAVEEQIENARQSRVDYVAKGEDGVIEEKDGLLLDVTVTDDREKEIAGVTNPEMRVVNFKEHLPEAVADALMGKKVGDTVEATAENTRENKAGAVISETDHYAVTIKEIQNAEVPELDDEFAKDMGEYETLADLRADVRKRMDEAEENRRRSDAMRAICDKLLETNTIDAPQTMVASSAQQLMQEEYYRLMMAGIDMRNLSEEQRAALFMSQQANAELMTRHMILVDEIGRIEEINPSDEDLDKEIERLAEEQGRRPLAVRAQMEAQKQLDQVKDGLRATKVTDFLLEKATVTYKLAEEAKEEEATETDAPETDAPETDTE